MPRMPRPSAQSELLGQFAADQRADAFRCSTLNRAVRQRRRDLLLDLLRWC